MRLKHLLIVAFVVLSAVPLLIGLQYLNRQVGAYSRQLFADHLSALSLVAKHRLETAVERIEENTRLIAGRARLRQDLTEFNRTRDPALAGSIARLIYDATLALATLKEVSVFDPKGELIVSTSPDPEIRTLDPGGASKPVVALTHEGGDVVATSITGILVGDEFVGYVRLAFVTDFIEELVRQRAGLGRTGEWLFAVRHESGDALFAVPLKYDHGAAFQRRVAWDRLDVPITQAMLGNEIIMGNAPDYLEHPVMASTRYLPGLDWGLVAKVSEEEVNTLVNRNNRLIHIAGVSIILLSVAAGVGLSFFIAKPIERLRAHTARVAKGVLEEPPAVGGWREVRELAEHFAVMIAALKEFNETLQSKVDERTRDLDEANRKLTELATQDPLTGLFNRRYLETCLDREIDRARRYGHPLAVAIMDIDHFKKVNDSYGHGVGDRVLTGIAGHLQVALRASDIVARIGGEEFCLVLPECQQDTALAILERVRTAISEMVYEADGTRFSVTCSFGVAQFDTASPDRDQLMAHADAALYRAKNSGRNRIVAFGPEDGGDRPQADG